MHRVVAAPLVLSIRQNLRKPGRTIDNRTGMNLPRSIEKSPPPPSSFFCCAGNIDSCTRLILYGAGLSSPPMMECGAHSAREGSWGAIPAIRIP